MDVMSNTQEWMCPGNKLGDNYCGWDQNEGTFSPHYFILF